MPAAVVAIQIFLPFGSILEGFAREKKRRMKYRGLAGNWRRCRTSCVWSGTARALHTRGGSPQERPRPPNPKSWGTPPNCPRFPKLSGHTHPPPPARSPRVLLATFLDVRLFCLLMRRRPDKEFFLKISFLRPSHRLVVAVFALSVGIFAGDQ